MEAQDALEGGLKDMRIISAAHALRTPLFVRKDSGMFKIADIKGKRVTHGLFRHAQHRQDHARHACDAPA